MYTPVWTAVAEIGLSRFHLLTSLKMSTFVFLVVTPCKLAGGYQCFVITAPKMKAVCPSEGLNPTFMSP